MAYAHRMQQDRSLANRAASILVLGAALACSAERASHPPPASTPNPADTGPDTEQRLNAVKASLNAAQARDFGWLAQQLASSHRLDAVTLREKRAVKFLDKLSYDPLKSQYLDRIQASHLGLDKNELTHLGKNGFVISARQAESTFVRGYAAIYSEHLPVYISADAILEAVHSSYDDILATTERSALVPMLARLLTSMHAALPKVASDFDPKVLADADVYLTVALSLLQGSEASTTNASKQTEMRQLYEKAKSASGLQEISLFGRRREVDLSQFTPRGHYTNEEALKQYFQAMIWLGRMELRLIETQPNGSSLFLRPQYQATLLLRRLMGAAEIETWERIDSTLQAFVGESDYMVVSEVDRLQRDLGGEAAALAASDEAVIAAIRAGGYGSQRIASQIMRNDGSVKTLPLDRSFLLFGQRYVLDSHVFSQVVYDRIETRLMPNPLDAAFAAIGNDQALGLLGNELDVAEYPGALDAARVLSDAHPDEFWGANLYTLWLGSLRSLSPASETGRANEHKLPEVMNTEAWGRRILNTQLASWAELRHDTLLYAKQSYSGVPLCEYPAAYVDPYPQFFANLRRFAERGALLGRTLEHELNGGTRVIQYFETLGRTLSVLEGMAQDELDGKDFSAEQLQFVNNAVRIVTEHAGCTTTETPDGWLSDLYFDRDKSIEANPTVADVHTQPADGGGMIVGNVLHVATGYPRLMVVTQNGCDNPRAYVGVVFSYHERTTSNFDRLTDERWAQELATPQPDVPWMRPIVAD